MKINRLIVLFAVLMISIYTNAFAQNDSLLKVIKKQLVQADDSINGRFPEYTVNGKWKCSDQPNWFAGFTGGELWYMYRMTNDEQLKERAIKHADQLLQYAELDNTHDLGFIFVTSCVKAYEITNDAKYKDAALKAARMLLKRFNKNGNFIRAWGKLGTPDREGLMIIDSMMNLELLFWAYEVTGDYSFYDAAYRHAITTMHQSIRSDYSSYHVIEFDPATGKVIKKKTHQGSSDESTWARGEAWGVYGFANAYKYTHDKRFLNIARRMADYFVAHLPNDMVPYWDLNLSGADVVRDASAGAIAASGMYLISDLSKNKNDVKKYANYAAEISNSLQSKYIFTKSKRPVEEGILLHTVYNFNKNWGVDESFPCGDYYFIELLEKEWERNNRENFIKDVKGRKVYNLDKNWFYLEDNISAVNQLYTTEAKWRKLNLPYTWNAFDVVDNEPGYRRDASWFQKNIYVPKLSRNQNLILYFEGANITSKVYVNNEFAGEHIGGYVGFEIDITPFVKEGRVNDIKVRVDNSYNPNIIPSQKSDFAINGGITRNVWLKVVPKNYLQKIKISTPQVSATSAKTSVEAVINCGDDLKAVLEARLFDPKGKLVEKTKTVSNLLKGENNLTINFRDIKQPQLWSPDAPNLYTVEVSLLLDKNVADKLSDRIGYRWYEFKDHGPFYLNGKKFLIRGTHRHEDYAGYGEAMPDSLQIKDIKMIKEMGANFVRLAHYPQSPLVYKECDELGLLVWDELPWCRGGVGKEEWKENTARLFKEQINQNFNHPSIIIWSLGNELDWLPDFPEDGGNPDSLDAFLRVLNNIAHTMDPSRLTAVRKYEGAAKIVDVFSPSIWSGWYSGVYKNYQKAIEAAQKKFPHMLHVEYGGDSHVGRHNENPITGEGILNPNEWDEKVNKVKVQNIANMGDWSENYIVDLFDWHLRYTELSENFSGNVQWAFKDFPTPLRPEDPIPYMNQKGLVDRAGSPKDAYYVFKSYWTKKPAFCYIESHTWTVRSGPKNIDREVRVYSNCDVVELFLNGVSQGRLKKDITKFPASGLTWKVKFNEGQNKLEATGFDDNKQVTKDEMEVTYTSVKNGVPNDILIKAEKLKNGNYIITATAVDSKGRRCLDYNSRVYFSSMENGELLENYGTPTGSSVIEMANGQAQIEFKPVPLSKAVIEVRNQDFKGSYVVIEDK